MKRKEIVLREKGLVSLGLCCLVAKVRAAPYTRVLVLIRTGYIQNLALNSFQLFFSQVKSSPETLRLRVLQAIFDIMMTYEKELMDGDDPVVRALFRYRSHLRVLI